jgi:hypothetical protein
MKAFLRIGLLLALTACACVGAFFHRADRILQRHEGRVQAAVADALRSARERPSPFGPPAEGSAWEAYGEALDELGPIGAYDVDSDRDVAPEMWARIEAAAAAFRRGLSRRLDTGDYDYVRGSAHGHLAPRRVEAVTAANGLAGLMERRRTQGREDDALELAVVLLGAMQDVDRATAHCGAVQIAEHAVERALRKLFEAQRMSASALRTFLARLELLDRGRAPIDEPRWIEEVLHTRAAEEAFRKGTDRSAWPFLAPGWRSLGSRRVAFAAYLTRMEDTYDAVREVARKPPWERIEAGRGLGWADTLGARWRSGFCSMGEEAPEAGHQTSAVASLNTRTVLRLAAALALYEAERGRPAERLEDLVPDLLPSIPVSPVTGAPFPYAPGALTVPDVMGLRQVPVWVLRRRGG